MPQINDSQRPGAPRSGVPGRQPQGLTRRTAGTLLATLLVLVAAVHVVWLTRDQSLMPFTDSYGYLTKLHQFLERLDLRSPLALWRSLGTLSLVGRPPFYQLATIPVIGLLGRSEDAAVLVNLLFLVLLAVSTYHVGRIVQGRGSGLLASLLVVTYPPIVHLSRMYLPHFALAALSALTLWLLLSLVEKRSIPVAWLLGLTVACGLWTHPYFATVSAVPTVLVGLYLFAAGAEGPPFRYGAAAWLVGRLRDRFVVYGLVPAGALASGLLVLWYAGWGTRSFNQFQGLAAGRQGGIGFRSLHPSGWWYAETAPGALTSVLAVTAGIGLVLAIVQRKPYGALLAVTLASAYAILSNVHLLGWIYFAPALPVVAVLSAVWIFELRRRWLRRSLIGLSSAAAVFSFAFVTWGGESWGTALPQALGSPDRTTCSAPAATAALCPAPAQRWSWPWAEARDRMLAESACDNRRKCRVLVVDISRTAALAFRYSLLADRRHRKLTVLRIGASRQARERPYDLETLLGTEFLLYPTVGSSPYAYGRATLSFLRQPPPEFAASHRTIATFATPLPEIGSLKLVQRTRPLTAGEATASIAALQLPAEAKRNATAVVARLHAVEGDPTAAVELYRRGLAEHPEDLDFRLGLAAAYGRMGDSDAALAELETAVELAPGKIRALLALAEAQVTRGRRAEAVALYERVLAIAPGHQGARKALRRLGDGA